MCLFLDILHSDRISDSQNISLNLILFFQMEYSIPLLITKENTWCIIPAQDENTFEMIQYKLYFFLMFLALVSQLSVTLQFDVFKCRF